jgi:ATP-dependent Lon protease
MTEKSNLLLKKDISNKSTNEVLPLVENKIKFFKDVIQKTIIHVQKSKFLDILGISDVSLCIEKLGEISKKMNEITEIDKNDNNVKNDNLINNLQIINNELSSLLKNYGTDSLEDLLTICFGNNNKITTNEIENEKMEILKKYFHPTSYKVVTKKDDIKQKKNEEIDENINLSCSDIVSSYKQFHMKVYGIKLYIHSTILKKSLVIFGIIDDVVVYFLNNKYVTNMKTKILENLPQEENFKKESFDKFISSLILKDYLIYENEHDIYNKYVGCLTQNNILKQKQISQTVKEFIMDDMFNKRNTLINLLILSSNYDNQYLAYLLYDLLSNDTNGNVDTQEQTILFDSFPWPIKQYFKQAMKKTVQYTNELSNFDVNKIPLEQQICLLKAPDTVKEKAMMKLKEVKAKSEDSGSKARQYLDGLIKIPFGVYKREPILNMMDNVRSQFKEIYKKYNIEKVFPEIPNKEKYTSIEVLKYVKKIQGETGSNDKDEQLVKIKNYLVIGDKKKLIFNITLINELLKKNNKKDKRIKYHLLNKDQMRNEIEKYLLLCQENENKELLKETIDTFISWCNINPVLNNIEVKTDLTKLNNNMKQITEYMSEVKTTLDKAVHGHDKAKKQIEKIIGQWINGEQDGYCFGFEGPPGIGKTSLAKRGLSDCLKDDKGVSRPFAMIQMGGDSNGSTLHGHNYTYVGSTWGSIVQILIDKKCMNPIIFIDEVDKISRTEHGKEIVGILTHLLDPAQNDCFQDKYFTGIDLDLSKALFILSYNDVDAIDKILLDRVHRIKFTSLSLEDKLIISKTHILPDVYKKMGLEDMIQFDDDVLKFIIEEYTLESGVRKLKEILFEIVGEINLDVLKNNEKDYDFPVNILIDDIKNKYFKDKREVKVYKIHNESKVGVINALWANQLSQGGVLPLQANFIPSNKFLELILTGSMGDVMKESISVSLTNAWNLTSFERQKYLIEKYNDVKNNIIYGIHIHCPDISTKKDGPSATTAFTVLIYSLLNDIKIKNYFGITGETHFGLLLTEIGGLQEKIIHSIKSGITEFIFPKENEKDFEKIMEKYKNNEIIEGIKFHSIEHIEEVFNLILDK